MLCVAQQNNDDRESHERSSGSSKSQAAQDRRIDILPAEDDDGTSMTIKIMIITTGNDSRAHIYIYICYQMLLAWFSRSR